MKPITYIFVIFFSAAIYVWLLYFVPRTDFISLLTGYSLISIGYLWLIKQLTYFQNLSSNKLYIFIGAAILFRLLAVFALPELSDDYFRFIWDGHLLVHGVNPFQALPTEIWADQEMAQSLGLTDNLFTGLNSPDYFTIYPPVNQLIFFLAAWLSPDSIYGAVLIMKSFIFLAELGSLFLIWRLLEVWELPLSRWGIYAFNPLVIIELCGNLHFEAFMIYFLLLFVWLAYQKKWVAATLSFALSVASKLLPIMLGPFLIKRLGWGRAIGFGALVALWLVLMFIPILDTEMISHMGESLELYFQRFEFNASVYYLLRWIGYQWKGYNMIATIGKLLPLLVIGGIGLVAIMEKKITWPQFMKVSMWAFSIYLLLASIVHPWYLTTLLMFSLFTSYRYVLVWTLLVVLSYAAYMSDTYHEQLGLVALEYLGVAAYFIWEMALSSSSSILRKL
ncbi:MAG: hypothetical protein AAF824_05275 [Bacteroidota bacterium]